MPESIPPPQSPELPNDLKGQLGVSIFEMLVGRDLGWVVRRQDLLDYGIDAHVEVMQGNSATGRLLAVQLKTGKSFFAESTQTGWVFRPSQRHVEYWLAYSLPVIVVLMDEADQKGYWEVIDTKTLKETSGGYKLVVPFGNDVSLAGEAWELLASNRMEVAVSRFEANLNHLPPACAKKLRQVSSSDEIAAAMMADVLATGRTKPELVIDSLLSDPPVWIRQCEADIWAAAAIYASEHGLRGRAAEALLLASKSNSDQEAAERQTVLAALLLLPDELSRAREILHSPFGPTVTHLVEVGRSALQNDGIIPESFTAADAMNSAHSLSDAVSQGILGDLAQRSSLSDEAVRRFEKAVELSPHASTAMESLALALADRHRTPGRKTSDLSRAIELLERALAQRRQWSGRTESVHRNLVRLLLDQGRLTDVIRLGRGHPWGEASPSEASELGVRVDVLRAAHRLGRRDIVEAVIDDVDDANVAAGLRFQFRFDTGSADPPAEQWQSILDTAVRLEDAEQAIAAILNLAGFGVDHLEMFDQDFLRRHATENLRDFAEALLVAHEDLDEALPALRRLAQVDALAAENLVVRLAQAGRSRDAATAADIAFSYIRDIELLVLKADVLAALKDFDAALSTATSALSMPDVVGHRRNRLHIIVAKCAVSVGSLELAAAHLELSLDLNMGPQTDTLWNLIQVYLAQALSDRALAIVQDHQPAIRDGVDARIWLNVMSRSPWTPAIASEAMQLTHRFASDSELSASLIGQLIQRTYSSEDDDTGDKAVDSERHVGSALMPSDFRRSVFEELDRHTAIHGSSSSIKKFTLDPEGDVLEQLKSSAGFDSAERNQAVADLELGVRNGQLPLGILSTLGGSYAVALARRAAGAYLAVDSDESLHELGVRTATAAIDAEVVIETSAVLVASLCGAFDEFRNRFSSVQLTTAAMDDIVAAAVDARGDLQRTFGFLGWDPQANQVRFREVSFLERAEAVERAEVMAKAGSSTVRIHVQDLGTLEELDDAHVHPWTTALAAAKNQGATLWSDDCALRQVARSLGIPAFGTLALMEALLHVQLEALHDSARIEAAVKGYQTRLFEMARHLVVDLPLGSEGVKKLAEIHGWEPIPSAVPLLRAAWWQHEPNSVDDYIHILQAAPEEHRSHLVEWQAMAMIGIAEANSIDPNKAALSLALLAALGFGPSPAVVEVEQGLLVAEDRAKQIGVPSPRLYLASVISDLAGRGYLGDQKNIDALTELGTENASDSAKNKTTGLNLGKHDDRQGEPDGTAQ